MIQGIKGWRERIRIILLFQDICPNHAPLFENEFELVINVYLTVEQPGKMHNGYAKKAKKMEISKMLNKNHKCQKQSGEQKYEQKTRAVVENHKP